MTTPFLTQSEIYDICAPLKRCDAIRRWFVHNGYTFKVKPNGMPLVSRAHFEAVTGTANASPNIQAAGSSEQTPDVANFLSQFQKTRKVAQTV